MKNYLFVFEKKKYPILFLFINYIAAQIVSGHRLMNIIVLLLKTKKDKSIFLF